MAPKWNYMVMMDADLTPMSEIRSMSSREELAGLNQALIERGSPYRYVCCNQNGQLHPMSRVKAFGRSGSEPGPDYEAKAETMMNRPGPKGKRCTGKLTADTASSEPTRYYLIVENDTALGGHAVFDTENREQLIELIQTKLTSRKMRVFAGRELKLRLTLD